MRVHIKLFAIARDRAGVGDIEIEVPDETTIGELRAALAASHPPLADLLPHMRFAVNSEYSADSQFIPAAAEVAIIPPVSGG